MNNTKRGFMIAASISLLGMGLAYLGGFVHARYLAGGRPPWFAVPGNAPTSTDHSQAAVHDHGSGTHSHGGHMHADHQHAHDDENSLELSSAAAKNLGLSDEFLKPIELTTFTRAISIPAIIVDRPGRTKWPVSAAMTGLVTHVHAVPGEAIESGDLMIEMRLTHEDLVTLQKDYLQALGERDVENKEIQRLAGVSATGAVATKTRLEREYSRDKLDSQIRAQREALRLHGLSDSQLEVIEKERRLLTEVRIMAPSPDDHGHEDIQLSRGNQLRHASALAPNGTQIDSTTLPLPAERPRIRTAGNIEASRKHLLVVQDLKVQKGQIVNAGDLLCVLADYDELLIEGQAFEAEASQIASAKQLGWKVNAILDLGKRSTELRELEFGWIENEIDPASRTLKFYVQLPNQIRSESSNATGQRFVDWNYRTGQRLQLQVPVEKWDEQIVLPVDAVVREGIESYVFQQNGEHYDRVSVHEKFRDQRNVVIGSCAQGSTSDANGFEE